MSRIVIKQLCCPALTALWSIPIVLMSGINAAAQVPNIGETIEERQHSRSQNQIDNFEDELKQAPSGITLPDLQQQQTAKTGSCVQVETVEINNLIKYSQKEFEEVLNEAIGKCLYASDINNLLRAITNRYIKGGFITSRAIIPEQDLTDGSLEIGIVEGKVEAIEAVNKAYTSRELAFAFPIRPNKRLNLRDIEQGIDQIARLPSKNPTSDIKAGDTTGGSIILIDNVSARKSFRGSFSIDNSGQSSTGETIISGSVSTDNVLGINDLWNVSANTSLDAGENAGAWGLNAFLSIPYGYFSTSFSGGFFAFESLVPGVTGDIDNDGTSWFATASLDWLVYRDATRKLSVTSGIGITDNDNFINDIRLLASSFRLAVVNLGFDYQERLFGGIASASASWDRGTNLLGADSILTGDDGPQRIFNKLEYDASFSRPITFKKANLNLFYSARLNGQFSDENLFSAQRISLGSPSAIRGFRSGGISGDEGIYLRQDLSWSGLCCEINSGWLADELDVSAFIGLDVGRIKRDTIDDFERGVLKSVTIGTRARVKDLLFNVSASRGFQRPFFVSNDGFEVNASLTYNF